MTATARPVRVSCTGVTGQSHRLTTESSEYIVDCIVNRLQMPEKVLQTPSNRLFIQPTITTSLPA
jgi:hypothetical protein